MPWASQRQAMFAGGALLIVLVIGVAGWFLFFHHTATCFDGIQNQTEEGIDCGGMCDKLCQAPRVSALWARSVKVAPGVYHAVAVVKNPETNAGTTALPYTFSLYDSENVLVAKVEGTMKLEPGEVVPLFYPNIRTGERVPVKTFVAFGQAVWKKTARSQSPVVVDASPVDATLLSLSVRVQNTTAKPVSKVILTALLYDASDTLVTASQTFVTDIPARGEKEAVFTWQEPFTSPVVRSTVSARIE